MHKRFVVAMPERTTPFLRVSPLFVVVFLCLLAVGAQASMVWAQDCVCTSFRCPPKTNETDSLALVALYNATDGPNWAKRETAHQSVACWLKGPVTTWFGIGIPREEDGRVTYVSLSSLGMKGKVPEQVGDLTELTWLQLASGELEGEIPAFIENFKQLQWLNLEGNKFTGDIPTWLSTLTNLTNLSLDWNQLTGPIPPELGNLSNLEWLALFRNQLTGSIPLELGNLPNLRTLTLHDNQLTGEIPPELGNLSKLIDLELADNQLTGAVPESFKNLSSLVYFFLDDNDLEDLPDFTGSLDSLTNFFVGGNKFTFDDLEPNAGFTAIGFGYSPQDSIETRRRDEQDGSIVLSADAGGTQTTYQWYRDGELIPDATDSTYTLLLADGAIYHNEARNPLLPNVRILSQKLLVDLDVCPAKAGAGCSVTVNSVGDAPDDNAGDNRCDTGQMIDRDGEEEPECTLRAAIQTVNASGGPTTGNRAGSQIVFDIPTSDTPRIQPGTSLDPIESSVEIDGTTPAGRVELWGTGSGEGLTITKKGELSTIRGLWISNDTGILLIEGSSLNTIDNCIISNNKRDGIDAGFGDVNLIQNNVISGNRLDGIQFEGDEDERGYAIDVPTRNIIQDNQIGTLANGTRANGNSIGINIELGRDNEIRNNVISGNSRYGVAIDSGTEDLSKGNKIHSNHIGVNALGTQAIPNGLGVWLREAKDTSIRDNVISGNEVHGVFLAKDEGTIVENNKIGTDKAGTQALGNKGAGIFSSSGGIQVLNNTISGNENDGIFLKNGSGLLIESNRIGTDLLGMAPLENDGHGIHAVESSFSIMDNVISANRENGLFLFKSQGFLLGNQIGTNAQGMNPDGRMGNSEHGVLIEEIIESQMAGGGSYNVTGNAIAFNMFTGVQLEKTTALIEENTIWDNQLGIRVLGGETTVVGNTIGPNQRNIDAIDAIELLIFKNNRIIFGLGSGTGIHLTRSKAVIEGNLITGDAGDGITLEQGSTATIAKNNIFDNQGFGLNNLDGSVMIEAQGNWWGDASGPGGMGSGSGDRVSTGVDYANWRTEMVSVVAVVKSAEIPVPIGDVDTVSVFVQNWEVLDDVVDLTLSDEQGWLHSPSAVSVVLNNDTGGEALFSFSIPDAIAEGTQNAVEVVATSRVDATHADTTRFTLIAQAAVLSQLHVVPDSVVVALGDSVQFEAIGLDQFTRQVAVTPTWNATGGTIDANGRFIAGTTEGTFTVTATAGGLEGQATVITGTPVAIAEDSEVPAEISLFPNYPNPFNPTTTIPYALSTSTPVRLVIYDLLGREVKVLVDAVQPSGRHQVVFDAARLPSGIYLYRLTADSFIQTRKMLLLK